MGIVAKILGSERRKAPAPTTEAALAEAEAALQRLSAERLLAEQEQAALESEGANFCSLMAQRVESRRSMRSAPTLLSVRIVLRPCFPISRPRYRTAVRCFTMSDSA
jgi:hypothetical protein